MELTFQLETDETREEVTRLCCSEGRKTEINLGERGGQQGPLEEVRAQGRGLKSRGPWEGRSGQREPPGQRPEILWKKGGKASAGQSSEHRGERDWK